MSKYVEYVGCRCVTMARICATANTSGYVNSVPCELKDLNGNIRRIIYTGDNYLSRPLTFNGIYATSDSIVSADETDYLQNKVDGITITYSNSLPTFEMQDNKPIMYATVIITNSSDENKTVGGLKKNTSFKEFSSSDWYYCLSWGYFFDEPIVLAPKESKTIRLALTV